jgi:hypothetical protein
MDMQTIAIRRVKNSFKIFGFLDGDAFKRIIIRLVIITNSIRYLYSTIDSTNLENRSMLKLFHAM